MSNTPNKPSSAEEDFFAREELEKGEAARHQPGRAQQF